MMELWKDEDGLTTVEYALLLALVAIAAIAAWQGLGTSVTGSVTDATAAVNERPATGTQ